FGGAISGPDRRARSRGAARLRRDAPKAGGFGGPFLGPPFLTVGASARGSLVALGVIRRGLRGRAARVAAAIHRRRRMGGGGHRRGRAGRGRWQRSVTLAAFAAPR